LEKREGTVKKIFLSAINGNLQKRGGKPEKNKSAIHNREEKKRI